MKVITWFSYILLTICFGAVSCRSAHDKELEKQLLGDWKVIKVGNFEQDKTPHCKMSEQTVDIIYFYTERNKQIGFIFYKDGRCENKQGFVYCKSEKRLFLGKDTRYRVENDSLRIWNPADSIWITRRLISINSDTLVLGFNGSYYLKLVKCHYPTSFIHSFDKIILCSQGGWGNDPIYCNSFDKWGRMICAGRNDQPKEGFYYTWIGQEKYNQILLDFQKANVDSLDETYDHYACDATIITVSFIKGHKIFKTILDNGSVSPAEFIWAYSPYRYLFQQQKLHPLKSYPRILDKNRIFYFETKNKVLWLRRSEDFYLKTELLHSKLTKASFEKCYTIRYYDQHKQEKQIFTDGRYYQYEENRQIHILDLGYNFLLENNMIKRFKKKSLDYE